MNSSQCDPPHCSFAPLAAVTGAGGFIGQHLVVALEQAGWRTRVLMRREPDQQPWRALHPQVVAGSLNDETVLERLVDGADAVIHVAGLIKDRIPAVGEIFISPIGAVVGAHAGPGTVALFFMGEER